MKTLSSFETTRIPRLLSIAYILYTCSAWTESDPNRKGADPTPPKPHIILMMADDLGWGDVGFHGSAIETPNLDRLAALGLELTRFYVQPVCSPTRASLMTGRFPMRYGLQCGVVRPWAQYGLNLDEVTLPVLLKKAGYRTAIVGKWHLGHFQKAYLPTERGFDLQYGHYNGALDYFTHVRDGGLDWHRNGIASDDKGYATDLIADEAVRIVKQHDKSKPLFLYVPFNAPHTPLQAPDAWIEQQGDFSDPRRRTYAAMVACMDHAVGRIVRALDEAGFPEEKTLIFFCSDNGGIRALGSNGVLREGKGTLYEGGVRVPAILVWKGQLKPGSRTNEAMHMVDLLPTLAGLAGADVSECKPLDGLDAWPYLSGAKTQTDTDRILVHNLTPFHAAITIGNFKLIRNGHIGANATHGSDDEKWELYDISSDIAEEKNLKDAMPRLLDRMKRELTRLEGEAATPNLPPNSAPRGFRSPAVWGNFD